MRSDSLVVVLAAAALLPAASAMTTPAPKPNTNTAPALRNSRNAGLRIAAGAALGNILQGFNTGVIGGALLYIVPEFGLETRPGVTGLIASSTTMGAVMGTMACGKLLQDFGRQRTLVISCILFLIGGALMGLAPDTSVLILGRVVGGMAAGLVSAAVPTYIAECAEPSQRGALSVLPQLCVSSGILLSYLVGLSALLFGGSWRLMLGFSILPAIAQACFVLTLPESPRWLLARRDDAAGARSALEQLRGTAVVDDEFAAMQAGLANERARAAEAAGAAAPAGGSAVGGGLLALVRNADARRALFVCSALQLFQQFCGVNAIVYFTPQILKQAGAPSLFLRWGVSTDAAAMLATVLAYLPKIPSVLLATYLIDRKGRRWMLKAFVPPLAACLALLAATVGASSGASATALSAFGATMAVTLFGVFFGMSLGPLPNILSAELFPTSVRGVGVATTTTVQWVSNMLVAALFPIAAATLGMTSVLWGFAGVCVLAYVVVVLFVPETKGVALEDIGGGGKGKKE